ncbi:MAG: flagellar hook-associated protein FlgK [Gammaproteobacteria bacterium]|nr:flagellar hook-associated protein FlgK [Gammaproteobacteria bacterium]
MAGGDILQIGLSGLAAFQRNLNTVGHNVANVNTPGYSRQRVIVTNNDPSPFGNGFVGNGVRLITTERMYNDFAVNQVRQRTSSTEFFSVFNEFATQIDNLLADQDAALAPAMEDFFDAIQGVSDDPTSLPAREVMMTQAEAMVDRIHTMDDWFHDLRKAQNARIQNQVSTINALAQQIADINQEVIVATGIGQGNSPNDILDQRDHLIDQLSEHIGITVIPQDDGSLNIFMGGGQSLVLGTQYRKLVAQSDPDDPLYYEVAYEDKYTNILIPITNTLKGGDLGGVIEFRNDILVPAQNYLGWIAQGLSRTFNDQHNLGIDLNDNLGLDFFVEPDYNSMMSSSVYNTGTATLSLNTGGTTATLANRIDVPDILPTDYELSYDGTNYNLLNLSNGTTTVLTVSVAGPPVEFSPVDGMYLELDVVPLAGDKFFIHGTRDASRKIAMVFDDPNLVAAASPLRSWLDAGNEARGTNTGAAYLSNFNIVDENLLNTGPILFPMPILLRDSGAPGSGLPANQYSIDGGGTWNAYNPAGTLIDRTATDGFSIMLTGNANDGDQFYVDNNGGTEGNQGRGQIEETTVTDPTLFGTSVGIPVNILMGHSGGNIYGPADQYSIDGGVTWNAYSTTSTTLNFTATDGWSVTLSGEAWVGDVFYVDNNTSGTGDNRNALALAALQLKGTMLGGNATYHEAYSQIVTAVGNRTQQAEINYRSQEALLNQSKELREAISGVNLDEEAADLLRYQQAYAAAAQVIAAADQVFQTLLQAVRG